MIKKGSTTMHSLVEKGMGTYLRRRAHLQPAGLGTLVFEGGGQEAGW